MEVAKQERVPVRIAHCHNAGFEGSRLAKYLKKEIHISRKEDYADAPTLRFACSEDAGKWLYNDGEPFTIIKNPVWAILLSSAAPAGFLNRRIRSC